MSQAAALLRRGAAPTFVPTSIAGLQAWYDASKITGLADGDPVASWADSSTNGKTLTQATGTKKPTYKTAVQNGLPGVRFDGVDDQLNSALAIATPPFSLVAVVKPLVLGAVRTVWGASVGQGVQARFESDGKLRMLSQNTTVIANSTAAQAAATVPLIFTVTYSAAGAYVFRVNGSVVDSGTNLVTLNGAATLTLGINGVTLGEVMNGDFHELCAFNAVLAGSDMTALEASYMKPKWGTP